VLQGGAEPCVFCVFVLLLQDLLQSCALVFDYYCSTYYKAVCVIRSLCMAMNTAAEGAGGFKLQLPTHHQAGQQRPATARVLEISSTPGSRHVGDSRVAWALRR